MSLGKILSSPKVWLMSLIYFSFVMGLYGVSFWLPTIIKSMGVSDALHVGLLSAIPYGAAVIGMLYAARSADRTGERRWHIAIPAFDRRDRAGAVGGVVDEHAARDARPHAGDDGHSHHAAAVLESADGVSRGYRRGGGYRDDQLARQSGGVS